MKLKPLYRRSLYEAVNHGSRDVWHTSFIENCRCARAIEAAIDECYDGKQLYKNCADGVIERFGIRRVNWVLANTVQVNNAAEISNNNSKWAWQIVIPDEDTREHFVVSSHPSLTNIFIDQSRKYGQMYGFYDTQNCISESDGQIDYTGKILAVNPMTLKEEYQTPEDQLFYASHGFGCQPDSLGTKIFGVFLNNGDEAYIRRYNVIGALNDESIPEWAKEEQQKYLVNQESKEQAQCIQMQ